MEGKERENSLEMKAWEQEEKDEEEEGKEDAEEEDDDVHPQMKARER